MSQFNEVKYFSEIARVRHAIKNLARQYALVETDAEMKRIINPYKGKIAPTGAIGVEFIHGLPQLLYTPYGSVSIDFNARDAIDSAKRKIFLSELKTTFGLVATEPQVNRDGYLEHGPCFAVTRLPWQKTKTLPDTYQRVDKSADELLQKIITRIINSQSYDDLLDNETENHVAEIYAQVNQALIQTGESEAVYNLAPTEIKKCFCTLVSPRGLRAEAGTEQQP